MKTGLVLSLITFCFSLCLNAQRAISGKGDIVTQEIQLETLNGVKLGFSGDIILTQGSPQKIVMEGQQNILNNIKRDVKDGVWRVYFDKNVRNAKRVKVYITLADLTEATVSGSGKLSGKNTFRNLQRLKVAVSGSGNINLSIEAGDVKSSTAGSGSTTLRGSARSLDVSISGSGKVYAADLQTADCDVSISGSGNAELYCRENMAAAISGSGNVRYKGDPQKVKASVSGSGNVREF